VQTSLHLSGKNSWKMDMDLMMLSHNHLEEFTFHILGIKLTVE